MQGNSNEKYEEKGRATELAERVDRPLNLPLQSETSSLIKVVKDPAEVPVESKSHSIIGLKVSRLVLSSVLWHRRRTVNLCEEDQTLMFCDSRRGAPQFHGFLWTYNQMATSGGAPS